MKIEGAKNIFIISHNGKKYQRIATLKSGAEESIEWKRHKSNHTVSKSESIGLEKEYNLITTNFLRNAAAMQMSAKTVPEGIQKINEKVAEFIRDKQFLGAIKYLKGETSWGLKECKEYVDAMRDRLKFEKEF